MALLVHVLQNLFVLVKIWFCCYGSKISTSQFVAVDSVLIYVNFSAIRSRIGQEQQFVLAAVLLCIVVDYRFARQPSVSRLKIMQ